MANYGVHHLKALAERGRSWMVRHENLKKAGERTTERGFAFLETAAGGLASGVISGRFPTTTFVGVPPDLAVGLVFSGMGIFHVLGKDSHHVGSLGYGMVAGFTARFGAGIGTKMRLHQPIFSSQTLTSGMVSAGALGQGRPMYTPQQAAAAAAAERLTKQVVEMPTG